MSPARPSKPATAIWREAAVLIAPILLLAGCGGPPPQPPPTIAQVKLVASSDVNPSQSGAGNPVVVRVYQLASPAAFGKAEFFPLLNTDSAVLGQDLVKRDDYLLAPGSTKDAAITLPDRVTDIGVFAVYRDFQTKTWRVDVSPPSHKTTPVTINLTAAGAAVAPAP